MALYLSNEWFHQYIYKVTRGTLFFINYYAPNDQQSQVATKKGIVEKLETISADKATSYIWGGNWNCVLNNSLDALWGVPSLKKE